MTLSLNREQLGLLRYVHVNMPWNMLHRYREIILQTPMNIEIGIAAEDLERVRAPDFQAAAAALHERGCAVTMHGPFWDLCPGSLDPLIRQASQHRLRQFFELTKIFEPLQVVCHTGFDPRHHRGHRKVWVENSVAAWEPLVKAAEERKTPLLLENVWEAGPEIHRELIDRIGSPWLGFCLDVGHQHSFSSTSLDAWLEAMSDRLKEIHLHDNDGTQDAHLPVGRGTIDFEVLFDFLVRKGETPVLTLEPHTEEHLTESLDGVRRFVQERVHRLWPS